MWRLAKKPTPPPPPEPGEGPTITWEQLDWDALRAHPKFAQYSKVGGATRKDEPTDLQVILTAITDHFRGLHRDTTDPVPAPPGVNEPQPPEMEPQTEPERITQERERERRHLALATRNRLAWQRFIRRYLDGLSDERFVELVASSVVATNAAIFNHLLALLVVRKIIDEDVGVECQLELWYWLFGLCTDDDAGFFGSLDQDEYLAARKIFGDTRSDAMLIAASYRAALLTRREGWEEDRIELRDLWRGLLGPDTPLIITSDVLRAAAAEAAPLTDAPVTLVARRTGRASALPHP